MKSNPVMKAALWCALAVVGSGCADVATDDPQLNLAKSSLAEDDGAIHAGCNDFRQQCRDGTAKGCEKYSQRCEVRIGVVGDSLSDEYQGFVRLPGVQWTEQVQSDLRISLGTLETNPAVRGEPRNDGYSTNWARFGQAALDLQWSNPKVQAAYTAATGRPPDTYHWAGIGPVWPQVSGLSAQIAAGEIDVALVWIGHNDLFIRSYYGFPDYPNPANFYADLVTRIVTIAATLRAADPQVKVAIVGLAGAAASLNPSISAAAAGAGIAFIDPFATVIADISGQVSTNGFYNLGGTHLFPFDANGPRTASPAALSPTGTGPCGFSPLGYGCSTPAYANPFRHWDGVHPNTAYMGLVGNEILRDVNDAFGYAMRTLPDAQLLSTAGL
jgi:lysophospholipase L1-like esterase